jgi:membrane-bound lytic murein transglycosylase D
MSKYLFMTTRNLLFAAVQLLLIASCTTLQTQPPADTSSAPATSVEADTARADRATTTTPESASPDAGAATPVVVQADFWQQLREEFRLPDESQPAVTRRIREYRNNARQVERIFKRGEPYLAFIFSEVQQRDFPAELVLLPFVESGYDPFAYSHGRAAGLWQFITATGKYYGLNQDWWYDGRRDIVAATTAALNYLDRLQQEFDGDWLLALAAYNAGEGTVRKAVRKNRKAGKPIDFWHLKLPKETSAYVPKLLAIRAIVEHPDQYGVALAPVDMEPGFTVVDTQVQLDIGIAAELAGMETDAIYRLNPGYNRWATHPDGPHRLVVPVEKSDSFERNLAALPDTERVKWVRHRIRKGETLSHIARRYDTTVTVLRSSNVLRGNNIRAGSHLLVPVAAREPARYAALARISNTKRSTGNKQTYKVRSGDSLWSVAQKHNVRVNQLTVWNRLDSRTIRPGQKLVIWNKGTATRGDSTTRKVSYTVRSGDSLYRISRKFSVSINELRRWNELPKGKYLQPGQRLKVYVDVTRQS